MKECRKCLQSKDESLFDKQSRAKDGLKSWCKVCSKEMNKTRYSQQKEKILSQVLEWQSKNPSKVAAAKEKYRNRQSVSNE